MTAVSEGFFIVYRNPLFEQASRFMIIAAALTAIPTALSGLAYGYDAHYEGSMASYFWWHRFAGISTMLLAITAASLRELHSEKGWKTLVYYYTCLALVLITVSIAGFLGGEMTFG